MRAKCLPDRKQVDVIVNDVIVIVVAVVVAVIAIGSCCYCCFKKGCKRKKIYKPQFSFR